MKLIQLNCWTGRLSKPLLRFLKEEKPDIVCLQEAIQLPGSDDIIFTSVDILQEVVGKNTSIYFSPVFNFNFMRRQAGFGNAIIAKLPIIDQETIFTNGDYVEGLDYKVDESNMRNVQHVVLDLNDGRKLNVLNHHGYHIENHKNGDDETLRQCKQIAEYISSLKGPVILTGDFNLAPSSESIKILDGVLTNLSTQNKLKTTRTNFSNKSEVCDYIFVNDEVKVKKFTASDAVVSDHLALVLEFETV